MIKAIIFDCFGVLVTDALDAIRDELGVTDSKSRSEITDILNASGHGFISLKEGREQVAKILGISTDDYNGRLANGEAKNQALLDYILTLRKNYKTAILSNVSGGGLKLRFNDEELRKYFDVTVASGDIGYAKPEAQAYEYVADQLGVRLEECVFIDDREDYCLAAQGVGMKTIRYEDFEQMKAELEKVLYDPER